MRLDEDGFRELSYPEYYRRMLKMEGRGPVTLSRCALCHVYREEPHRCSRCTGTRIEWGLSALIIVAIAAVLLFG
jgi:hypothetical protein